MAQDLHKPAHKLKCDLHSETVTETSKSPRFVAEK